MWERRTSVCRIDGEMRVEDTQPLEGVEHKGGGGVQKVFA